MTTNDVMYIFNSIRDSVKYKDELLISCSEDTYNRLKKADEEYYENN